MARAEERRIVNVVLVDYVAWYFARGTLIVVYRVDGRCCFPGSAASRSPFVVCKGV